MDTENVRFKSEPFTALVVEMGNEPIECEAVVWDGELTCGVGIFSKESGHGHVWGLMSPRNFIASWRATEVLRCLDTIEDGTLCYAYYTGLRNPHSSDLEQRVKPMIEKIGQPKYDEIMSLPVPLEIIRAMLDGQQGEFKPDLWPITDEVRAGTITWREEFADAGIQHPDAVDAEQRAREETIFRFESLLSSYAESQDMPRDCFGMDHIEAALLTLLDKVAESQHPKEVLVALAGVVGNLAMSEFTTLMMPFHLSPQQFLNLRNEEKKKGIGQSAEWLASVCGRPWYQFRQRPNTFTVREARNLLRQLLEQYFPLPPREQDEEK